MLVAAVAPLWQPHIHPFILSFMGLEHPEDSLLLLTITPSLRRGR